MKSQPPDAPPAQAASYISGRLLLLGFAFIVLAGATLVWWFQYSATHRAAEFWGPEASLLIRDATQVEFVELQISRPDEAKKNPSQLVVIDDQTYTYVRRQDISHAHGLLHLRFALLRDASFLWPPHSGKPGTTWRWGIEFSHRQSASRAPSRTIYFSSDCQSMMRDQRGQRSAPVLSCEPIAAGLREMFEEFSSNSSPDANNQSR
ncbi:MAG TPA: hypothetical protein VHE81_17330 [Lacipirellulaceae bacterium]|nr:hypothetical protein [Lacipirellulaceae bacterium]